MNIERELQYRMFLDRFAALRNIRDGLVCLRWASGVAHAPFPPAVKRAFLRDLAEKYRLDLLVETGTFFGDTSAQLAGSFRKVYTVEAAKKLFDAVGPRFASIQNIHRYYGDSGSVLSAILPLLDGPALFWLDAHVQGLSQDGELNPILREVCTITADGRFNHVLAIDDMRLFGKAPEYPTVDALRTAILKSGRGHHFAMTADIGVVCLESAVVNPAS